MVRGVLEKRRLAALLLVLLSGCGGDPSSTSQDAQSQAGSTAPAEVQGESGAAEAAPAEASATLSPQQQSVQLAEKAEQALREEHLFAPAGSNAFEWFLQAHELDRDNVFARDALFDLIPYAVMHIEQRIAARDRSEAANLLPLLQRAQPDAPALPRLQRALAALPTDSATAETGNAARPVPVSPSNLPREVPASAPIAVQPTPPAPNRPHVQASAEAAVVEAKPEPPAQGSSSNNTPSEEQRQEPVAKPITETAGSNDCRSRAAEPLCTALSVLAERRKIEGSVELNSPFKPTVAADVRVLRSQPEEYLIAMPSRPCGVGATRLFRRQSGAAEFDFKLGKS